MKNACLLFGAGMMTVFLCINVHAASIESLVMPGKVIEGHADIETQCNKCHQKFSKTGQAKLCMDCHEEIEKDVNDRKGFHGNAMQKKDVECKACHTEHKGRSRDIVQMNKGAFNHKLTDFHLKGRHAATECSGCHEEGNKYREAPSDCFSCHEDKDRHQGKLGKKCGSCHKQNTWLGTGFDHDKTDFSLKGKHEKTTCNACHPNENYKGTPKDCFTCHRLEDEHVGAYGKKCNNCHVEKAWDNITFDHTRETKFRLTGKHKTAECTSCHQGDLYKDKLKKSCHACHKFDDEHKGVYGKDCKSCHNTETWGRVKFDHDRDTKFVLRGKHKKAACNDCHRENVSTKQVADCIGCHKGDDIHAGQQGKNCNRCHNEAGWRNKVAFDHDLSRFPLIGLHAVSPCEECHVSARYQDASLKCNDCHKKDDVHKGGIGKKCENCHTPNSWGIYDFDHDRQTDFRIDGGHKDLACNRCHKHPVESESDLSMNCSSCHQADDVHSGQLGPRCNDCHNTENFREIEMIR